MMLTTDSQNERDTLPTERVGIVVFLLMDNRGERFTTAELARAVSLQQGSIWLMLCKLSRKLPIIHEFDCWYIP